MAEHGVVCSMSRSGNVWDNAAMESFFSELKTERTARKTYRTRDEAKADVFDYVERFSNLRRQHSTIDYLSPVEFDRQDAKVSRLHARARSAVCRTSLSVLSRQAQPYEQASARPDQKLRPSGAVSEIRTRGEIIEACESNGGPEQPREDAVKGLEQRQAPMTWIMPVARTKPTA
jgi:putative transposase